MVGSMGYLHLNLNVPHLWMLSFLINFNEFNNNNIRQSTFVRSDSPNGFKDRSYPGIYLELSDRTNVDC